MLVHRMPELLAMQMTLAHCSSSAFDAMLEKDDHYM